tara:strand:- start:85 stop:456 length:372 start_codon:yes stop_codon:yes gene_type:complete
MALEGKYTYKGIDIAKAYVMVTSVNTNNYINSETTEKTPKKYNEDGSVKSEAVMETKWIKNNSGNWSAAVYKDKDARTNTPNVVIDNIGGNFDVEVKASGKNPVAQAYAAIKVLDAYKDYTDA